MDTKELLQLLDEPNGVSGSEYEAAQVVKNLLAKYCENVHCDTLGNVIGEYKCGKESAFRLMLEAHMDEVGMMVSGFAEEGSLLFVPIGGLDQKILPGSEVTVHSANGDFYGVIGAKPPHLTTDRSKAVAMADMSIDVGFDEKKSREIFSIGDIITFNTGFTPLCTDYVAGRCFDNRGGVATVIKALDYMKEYKLECDVIFCITVQEELGMRGSKVIAKNTNPDAAIVVDAGFGNSHNSHDGFDMGKGCIVSVGPNLHPKLTRLILDTAAENKLETDIDVDSGNTGTDAWEIQVSNVGVPTALLSFPVRYMHSYYEVVNVKDIENTAKIIALTALRLKGGDMLCY